MPDNILSSAELDVIEQRVKAATEGPWDIVGQFIGGAGHFVDGVDESVCDIVAMVGKGHDADREFIAHSRTDVSRLIATVRTERTVRLKAFMNELGKHHKDSEAFQALARFWAATGGSMMLCGGDT